MVVHVLHVDRVVAQAREAHTDAQVYSLVRKLVLACKGDVGDVGGMAITHDQRLRIEPGQQRVDCTKKSSAEGRANVAARDRSARYDRKLRRRRVVRLHAAVVEHVPCPGRFRNTGSTSNSQRRLHVRWVSQR
jgi:hypothetical protein